jgi:transcriptional regulator with XRE-family HTH domain
MNKSYSELLQQYIDNSKLSLSELSARLTEKNIRADRSYISKLKNGNKPPASDEVTKALAEITGGDYKKLLVAAQMERLNPILEDLGEIGFNEFLNSVIGHMVTRDHFVEDFNSKLKKQCQEEGRPFFPMSKDAIKEHFSKVSMDEKLMLSQFFSYSFDEEKKTYTVHPYRQDTDHIQEIPLHEYKRVYESLVLDDLPPDDQELLVLRIALQAYRLGKDHIEKN